MTQRRISPVRFRWIEWNLEKIARHGFSREDVEFAWHRSLGDHRRSKSGTLMYIGRIPSGRMIQIVWIWDEELDVWAAEGVTRVVFVITAFETDA